jgi:hypothetical protein
MLKDRHTYRCAFCGAVLDLAHRIEPRIHIEGTSGRPNVRVLTIEGEEVHRCTVVTRKDLAVND